LKNQEEWNEFVNLLTLRLKVVNEYSYICIDIEFVNVISVHHLIFQQVTQSFLVVNDYLLCDCRGYLLLSVDELFWKIAI